MRTFAGETVSSLEAINKAARLPGVESATVDNAKMVAHLAATGAMRVSAGEPAAAVIAV